MYNKPEVVILANAITAVQGVNKICSSRDNANPHPLNATSAAYESDE
jgi:hypothetical protein